MIYDQTTLRIETNHAMHSGQSAYIVNKIVIKILVYIATGKASYRHNSSDTAYTIY